jgi:hypothetical protein
VTVNNILLLLVGLLLLGILFIKPSTSYICSTANTQYIQVGRAIAPLLDIDGNPVKCGESGLERKDYQD